MQNRKVYINPHNNLLSLEERIYELVDVKQYDGGVVWMNYRAKRQ